MKLNFQLVLWCRSQIVKCNVILTFSSVCFPLSNRHLFWTGPKPWLRGNYITGAPWRERKPRTDFQTFCFLYFFYACCPQRTNMYYFMDYKGWNSWHFSIGWTSIPPAPQQDWDRKWKSYPATSLPLPHLSPLLGMPSVPALLRTTQFRLKRQ